MINRKGKKGFKLLPALVLALALVLGGLAVSPQRVYASASGTEGNTGNEQNADGEENPEDEQDPEEDPKSGEDSDGDEGSGDGENATGEEDSNGEEDAEDDDSLYVKMDLSTFGSISVTMRLSDGTAVAGGSLALYQIALPREKLVDGKYVFDYVESFADCDESCLTNDTYAEVAAYLQDYVNENGIEPYATAEIGSDGTALFFDLPVGLYLVIQTETPEGYYTMNSFTVTVPMIVNGVYVYDVDASPKAEVEKIPVPPEEPKEPEEPVEPEEPETPEEPGTPEDSDTPEETTVPETSTELTLPQTGFILWPIILCGAIGTLLLIIGYRLAFCGPYRLKEHEA